MRPQNPKPVRLAEKFDLWRKGTLLRGGNIWRKYNDTEECPGGICPAYRKPDIGDLESWKANYVNILFDNHSDVVNLLAKVIRDFGGVAPSH